jgi:predicted amidophosphoribosyltransferase
MSMSLRRPDPSRCHNCGERVTPYAAGCRLCGADLDPVRRQRSRGPLDRLTDRWRALFRRA